MATGIVSVGLSLDGRDVLGLALLWIAIALWLGLTSFALAALAVDPGQVLGELRDSSCLAGAAASCVIATALADRGHHVLATLPLVAGTALLAAFAPRVLAGLGREETGSAFLLSVSPFAVAVAATALATWAGQWLLFCGVGFAALGALAYGLALIRFDYRQLSEGSGDQWVIGGAAAIGALACSQLAVTGSRLDAIGALEPPLRWAALAFAGTATAWFVVLAACEMLRPRLRFDGRRWATAFPIGMYGAMCFSVSVLETSAPLRHFARLWVWVGFAVWVACAIAAVSSLRPAPGLEPRHS